MMLDYRLDVLHYYSLPGFSWDACLLFSGVTCELLTCEEILAVILDGIKGNITHSYNINNCEYIREILYYYAHYINNKSKV